jgi:diacylglycerol O-acyltransferase 1
MDASIDAAVSFTAESKANGLEFRHTGEAALNGNVSNGSSNGPKPQGEIDQKYRHITAVHSRPRTSCLSHDSHAAPSFLGFRNLMVIVLSIVPLHLDPGPATN